MKVFFVIRSTSQFYYVRSIISALMDRGHILDVFFEHTKEHWLSGEYLKPIEEFRIKYPDFKYGVSYTRTDIWRHIVMPARVLLNYRRFLINYTQSVYFQNRMIKFLPKGLQWIFAFGIAKKILKSELAAKVFYKIEDIAGVDSKILAQIKSSNPDLVIITVGGMRYGTIDLDYIKAARELGIKSAAVALTWDSLSTKALIQIKPDLLLCWNEMHAGHAAEHHGITGENIAIAGSYMFDDWFNFIGKPSTAREEFCKKYGLDPKHHIITYLGSASTTAPDERWLIKELRDALDRAKDARMKGAQIIYRPHPTTQAAFADVEAEKLIVLPKGGSLRDSKKDSELLYDTFHHSLCVFTVFTTGIVDAIIADKPVIALMRKQFELTQAEAEHFKEIAGGNASFILNYSSEKLVENIRRIADGMDEKKDNRKAFVQKYIRPLGSKVIAGDAAAKILEKLVS